MPIKRKLNLDCGYKKNTNGQEQRTITDFLSNEYKEFSMYCCETRACPSIWDGLKITGRKILYSAFTGELKNGAEKKVPTLVGECFTKTAYAHGDAACT